MLSFKSNFLLFFVSVRLKKYFEKSLEKEVTLSWKSLENHSQFSVRTLCYVGVNE